MKIKISKRAAVAIADGLAVTLDDSDAVRDLGPVACLRKQKLLDALSSHTGGVVTVPVRLVDTLVDEALYAEDKADDAVIWHDDDEARKCRRDLRSVIAQVSK